MRVRVHSLCVRAHFVYRKVEYPKDMRHKSLEPPIYISDIFRIYLLTMCVSGQMYIDVFKGFKGYYPFA